MTAPPATTAPPVPPPATTAPPPATVPPQIPPNAPMVRYSSPPRDGHPNYALAASGAVMFGVSYLFSAGLGIRGLADNDEEQGVFLIPIVGPVVFAATVDDGDGFDNDSLNAFFLGFFVFDTLFQAAGLAMLIGGMATTSRDKDARIPDVHVGAGHATATWRF